MPVHLGSAAINAAYLGASAVDKVYLGPDAVYTALQPPAQVTGLAVDATGDGTLDLSWTAPASDAAITDYSVEYTPSGGSATTVLVGSAATSYQLTSLTNDTEYSVRVAAVSAAGTGAYSTAVTGTPSALVTGTAWSQLGSDISPEGSGDMNEGRISLSDDGQVLAIGAMNNDGAGNNAGHVRVFAWNGTAWVQRGSDIDGEYASDEFGRGVALSGNGNVVAGGSIRNDDGGTDAGHVRVFAWNGSAWAQRGSDIDGENPGELAGRKISLSTDGNRIAVGLYAADLNGTDSGGARVYEWDGTTWTKLGSDIVGEAAGDLAGLGVSISGDGNFVAVGAQNNDGTGADAGHVRVFAWNGTAWVQRGGDIEGENAGDNFGFSLRLNSNGTVMAAGGWKSDDGGTDSGHVRVFEYDGTAWSQRGTDLVVTGSNEWATYTDGVGLNSSGSVVAIGWRGFTSSANARVLQWDGTTWNQLGADFTSGGAARVALNGSGAIFASATQSDQLVRVYQFS